MFITKSIPFSCFIFYHIEYFVNWWLFSSFSTKLHNRPSASSASCRLRSQFNIDIWPRFNVLFPTLLDVTRRKETETRMTQGETVAWLGENHQHRRKRAAGCDSRRMLSQRWWLRLLRNLQVLKTASRETAPKQPKTIRRKGSKKKKRTEGPRTPPCRHAADGGDPRAIHCCT